MARKRRLFEPGSDALFPLSRSKLDLYLNCPRCFYLDRRLGIGRPSGPPFTLNTAVDQLLKSEFDEYRVRGEPILTTDELRSANETTVPTIKRVGQN